MFILERRLPAGHEGTLLFLLLFQFAFLLQVVLGFLLLFFVTFVFASTFAGHVTISFQVVGDEFLSDSENFTLIWSAVQPHIKDGWRLQGWRRGGRLDKKIGEEFADLFIVGKKFYCLFRRNGEVNRLKWKSLASLLRKFWVILNPKFNKGL